MSFKPSPSTSPQHNSTYPHKLIASQPQHASDSHYRRLHSHCHPKHRNFDLRCLHRHPHSHLHQRPSRQSDFTTRIEGEDKKIVGSCKLLQKHKLHQFRKIQIIHVNSGGLGSYQLPISCKTALTLHYNHQASSATIRPSITSSTHPREVLNATRSTTTVS